MKKVIKTGLSMLATTACALTLAYSQPSTEGEKYSLEKAAGVYETYITLLNPTRKHIKWENIEHLNNYLEEHMKYIPDSKEGIEKIVNYINNKRESEAKYTMYPIKNEELKEEYNSLMWNLKIILKNFPGLIEKDMGIVYPSTQQLDKTQNLKVKYLIKKSHESLKKRKSQSLFDLTKKEQYTIQDLLTFYTILKEKEHLYDATIEKKVKVRKPDISFVNYLDHKKAFGDYIKSVKNWRKENTTTYISPSVYSFSTEFKEWACKWKTRNPNETDSRLEELLSRKLEIIDERHKIETFIPLWLSIILGFSAAWITKGLITKYTRRKWDVEDRIEAGFSSMVGGMILDSVHPWIFPIRVLAIPFISEIIGKNTRKKYH